MADETYILAELSSERVRFLRFVQRRVRDEAVAEDLLQTAYADAVRQAKTLRDAAMARAWFYKILRNRVIDYYRHQAVEERVLAPITENFDVGRSEATPPNLCQCIGQAVEDLKPEYADVLRSVDLSEENGALALYAERAGITATNAAVRGHRARKALARGLRATCGSCAGAGCLDCTCRPQPELRGRAER